MPDQLFHFSEDPSISRFESRVAPSDSTQQRIVWAIDAEHADLYYFPRDCPRVTFFAAPETISDDVQRFIGLTTARRVSAIEAAWLPALRTTQVYRYVLPARGFELVDDGAGYWVSRDAVEPLRVEPVGDLIEALVQAGVELRIMPSIWELHEAVIASSLGFSNIRIRNAVRPEQSVRVG